MAENTERKADATVQDPVEESTNNNLLSIIKDSILEKFPTFEILDLDDLETREKISSLEKISYENSGYGDNTEGKDHFSRISEYSENSSLALGMLSDDKKELLYYIHFTILSPNKTVFYQDNELYLGENADFLKFPGLVFNKILRSPAFNDPHNTGAKIDLFLIQKLLEASDVNIRIEEQCQPDSYKFFKMAERMNRLKIAKDILVENRTGVNVHKILAIIYNETRNIKFLEGINGRIKMA